MRICPVGAKLFKADRWTDRHDEAASRFHNSANMPQKERQANGQNWLINPLKTKRRLLYLKTQSVPRCKHFSSQL